MVSLRFGRELLRKIKEDRVVDGAAALAFYWMLALFPAAIFLLTLIPYLPVPQLEQAIMDQLHRAMPPQAAELFAGTVNDVVSNRKGGLLTFGLLFALWSASRGMYAVMEQLDITHEVDDTRGFFKANAQALLLTIGVVLLIVVGFALVVFGGLLRHWIVEVLGLSEPLVITFTIVRFVVIAFTLLFAIALLYKFGPDVDRKFKLITPGTVLATIAFAAAAFGFRFYVTQFGKYDKIYGSLGAVIVLLVWLFVMGLVLLVGSEIDALTVKYEPRRKHSIRTLRTHDEPA